MSSLRMFAAGAGVGAAAAWLLDNEAGNRRRRMIADKAGRFTRRGASTVQGAGAQAQGLAARAQHAATGGDSPPGDDNTLKGKVESEIFRDADAPKGNVDVTVVNGIVELRGQIDDPSQSEALELKTRMVSGVKDVRNLLHLPGETPANVAGTPGVSSS